MTGNPHARAALDYLDNLCRLLDRGLRLRRPVGPWWTAGACLPVGLSLCLAGCSPEPPARVPVRPSYEVCDDRIDNDGNGRTDCADQGCDCATPDAAGIVLGPERDCQDGLDDDGDGRVDCYDEDCMSACAGAEYAAPVPTRARETRCHDGEDDDGDGWVDCRDPDCIDHCATPAYAAPRARREYGCFDGVDDDGDGAVDCDDVDCLAACRGAEYAAPIPSYETDCGDGFDNDADGRVDRADPDCQPSVALYAAPSW